LLEVRDLTKSFGGLVAVSGVNFGVRAGEIVGLIGPNGAGKTTTFNLITGLAQQSSGEVRFLDRQIDGMAARHISRLGIARTFQHVKLVPDMTVLDNVALGAHLRGRAGVVAAMLRGDRAEEGRLLKEAARLLERVGLAELMHRPAVSLALGQSRIVEIARALCLDPLLLLLDEPTTGLDPQARHLLWDRLYRLKQRGVTLCLTTHYMDEAEQLCDRLVVMDRARIVAEGSPRELIDRYVTREVLELRFRRAEGEADDSAFLDGQLEGLAERIEQLPDRVLVYTEDGEAAASAAYERGLRPASILVRRSSLEDVFLRLTGRSLVE
jgi:lipooligosaccharide transport system ATP-binding protein